MGSQRNSPRRVVPGLSIYRQALNITPEHTASLVEAAADEGVPEEHINIHLINPAAIVVSPGRIRSLQQQLGIQPTK